MFLYFYGYLSLPFHNYYYLANNKNEYDFGVINLGKESHELPSPVSIIYKLGINLIIDLKKERESHHHKYRNGHFKIKNRLMTFS
jgi:hypothetical protein